MKLATLGSPLVGAFHDDRAELLADDTFNDRAILVRGVWSNITPNTHRYQEDYSDDGGHTWRSAFVADLTRAEPTAAGSNTAQSERSHDFDFGTWRTHSSRLLHPVTGSKEWAQLDGTTVVHKIWGGRANLAEYKAEGPQGTVELLSLRWYNPNTHQWNLDFATFGRRRVGESRRG